MTQLSSVTAHLLLEFARIPISGLLNTKKGFIFGCSMIKSIKKILLFFAFTFGILACNSLAPTGFWNTYQKGFLVQKKSDQGPYGGYRAMHWQKELPNRFSSGDVLSFAKKNGWELTDSLDVTADQLKKWYYNNDPVFPLSYSGFATTTAENNSMYNHFPRLIHSSLKVYMFKTGWLAFEPDTDNTIEINGFVLMSKEGNEMSVYHLWGE